MFAARILGLLLACSAGQAAATDCSAWPRFASSEPYLKPLSVPAAEIGAHLTASSWSDGVEFSSEMRGRDLWLDITHFPGQTSAAAAPAAIMRTGRLADNSFDRLVLSHDGTGLFSINRGPLREIGCRFIWGREGGENPIALLRELYQQLSYYETGQSRGSGFNGSLLGDTHRALQLNNEVLLPAWVIEDVR
mgnify:CR=1 FL=1